MIIIQTKSMWWLVNVTTDNDENIELTLKL